MIIGVIAVFIPIVMFVALFAYLSVASVARHKYRAEERMRLYDTARAAVEKGQPLPPEVITAMSQVSAVERTRGTAFSDLRTGVILTAVGAGVAVFGFLGQNFEREVGWMIGIAAVPGLIGVSLIVLSFFNPNKDKPN